MKLVVDGVELDVISVRKPDQHRVELVVEGHSEPVVRLFDRPEQANKYYEDITSRTGVRKPQLLNE